MWKSHRKEVQKTEHNPKKTQHNAISRDNKRGKGDGVGLHPDSIEMVSVPDSKLTVVGRGKAEEKKGGRDKWQEGDDLESPGRQNKTLLLWKNKDERKC